MGPKVWAELENGAIQIITLEPERFKEAEESLYINFFPYENICIACDLVSNKSACKELAQLASWTAKDGVSLIAIEKETNKVIGVSFNKVQTISNEPNFFEKFRDEQCKEKNSKSLMNFMITMDASYDVFDAYNVDCVLEIMFLGVNPEHGKKGIGKTLVDCSISLVKSLEGSERIPKLACSLFTSAYSQKIGIDLNFTEVFREKYTAFSYEGLWKYSDKIDGNIHSNGAVTMVKDLR